MAAMEVTVLKLGAGRILRVNGAVEERIDIRLLVEEVPFVRRDAGDEDVGVVSRLRGHGDDVAGWTSMMTAAFIWWARSLSMALVVSACSTAAWIFESMLRRTLLP